MSISSTVRNVLIILALAAIVAFVPGGGTGGSVILTVVYLIFLAALGWVGSIVYRERRGSLYLLGEGAGLYGAIVALAVTLTRPAACGRAARGRWPGWCSSAPPSTPSSPSSGPRGD